MRISAQELIIVLAIVLIVFGPKQLPKLAKMFGKATKEMKNGLEEGGAEADAESAARTAKAETKSEEE